MSIYKFITTLNESTIDYPREGLSREIWDIENDEYVLRKDVELKILDTLKKYTEVDLEELADEIHITGSIGTNQYDDDADLDIHIVPKDSEGLEDLQKDVFKWFNNNRDEIDGYVGEHPIEVYIQLNPEQEYLADACYDVRSKEWLRGPNEEELDFDPYDAFEDVLKDVEEVARDTDLQLGELKRDATDYEVITNAIAKASPNVKQQLLSKLESKMVEIEKNIKDLQQDRKNWSQDRKRSSKTSNSDDWKNANAKFKFLNRYNYMRLIKDIEKMLVDGELSKEELSTIQSMI